MPLAFDLPAEKLGESWIAISYRSLYGGNHTARKEGPKTRLGSLAGIASGSYAREYIAKEAGIPYLRIDNLRRHVLNMGKLDLAHVEASGFPVRGLIKEGDVLTSRTGTIGRTAVAPPWTSGYALSQHVSRIRLGHASQISPESLALYLNSPSGVEQLMSLSAGTTRLELTHEALARVSIPEPPPRQVIRLGGKLKGALRDYYAASATMDGLVAQMNGLLESATGFQARGNWDPPLFSSVDAADLTDLWLPKVHSLQHEELEKALRRLGSRSVVELGAITRGKGTRTSEYSASGVPFLRTASLFGGGVEAIPTYYASAKDNCIVDELYPGDTLLSIEGRVGETFLAGSGVLMAWKNHIVRIRPTTGFDDLTRVQTGAWIYLFLRSFAGGEQIRRFTVIQSTIPAVAARLYLVEIPAPNKTCSVAPRLSDQTLSAAHDWQSASAAIASIQLEAGAYFGTVTR